MHRDQSVSFECLQSRTLLVLRRLIGGLSVLGSVWVIPSIFPEAASDLYRNQKIVTFDMFQLLLFTTAGIAGWLTLRGRAGAVWALLPAWGFMFFSAASYALLCEVNSESIG